MPFPANVKSINMTLFIDIYDHAVKLHDFVKLFSLFDLFFVIREISILI